MRFTDYLAIWGAFIGTVVAGWNIYKDFLQRDRVQVTVGFRIQFPPRQEVFVYQVTNLSSHKITVTHCAGYPDRKIHRRWLRTLLRRFLKHSSKGFLWSFTTLDLQRMPITIEPWNNHIFTFGVDSTFPVLEEACVFTGDGREWFCPRKDIATIHADETYKAIQAKRAADITTGLPDRCTLR